MHAITDLIRQVSQIRVIRTAAVEVSAYVGSPPVQGYIVFVYHHIGTFVTTLMLARIAVLQSSLQKDSAFPHLLATCFIEFRTELFI